MSVNRSYWRYIWIVSAMFLVLPSCSSMNVRLWEGHRYASDRSLLADLGVENSEMTLTIMSGHRDPTIRSWEVFEVTYPKPTDSIRSVRVVRDRYGRLMRLEIDREGHMITVTYDWTAQ